MSEDSCGCSASAASTAATLDEMDFERGIWTPALDGDADRVRAMLGKNPAWARARDSSGMTGLHYASRSGAAGAVRALLSAGADPDAATTAGGVTSLQRAALMGKGECVKLLLAAGADPGLRDADGRTALHRAAERNRTECYRTLLAAAGPDADSVADAKGRTPKDYIIVAAKEEEKPSHS